MASEQEAYLPAGSWKHASVDLIRNGQPSAEPGEFTSRGASTSVKLCSAYADAAETIPHNICVFVFKTLVAANCDSSQINCSVQDACHSIYAGHSGRSRKLYPRFMGLPSVLGYPR